MVCISISSVTTSNIKIMLRTFVTFEAAFPDDGEWDEHENPIRPPGKNVAEAIAQLIEGGDVHASSPSQYKFYGWELELEEGTHRAWCLLQYPGPWLLMIEPRLSMRQRLFQSGAENEWFAALLDRIGETLRSDPRFTGIRWFTEEEYAMLQIRPE
jgi:hypothetical protein